MSDEKSSFVIMASNCADVFLALDNTVLNFIQDAFDNYESLTCYGCELDHPSQKHHPCVMEDTVYASWDWNKTLAYVDEKAVRRTYREVLRRLDLKECGRYSFEKLFPLIMMWWRDEPCDDGSLFLDVIDRQKRQRKLLDHKLVFPERISTVVDACHEKTLNHNSHRYRLRILALEDASRKGTKTFDPNSVVDSFKTERKHLNDFDTFDQWNTCDVIQTEMNRLKDVNHLRRVLDRYNNISGRLSLAERIINKPMDPRV